MTTPYRVKSPRKLIEVALPLDAINLAAVHEKSIRHGHPSTLHLWWARRPLAVARAVIFAQMVNDPGYQQGAGFKYGKNKRDAAVERKRLFKIIEDLVLWENTTNETLIEKARAEIRRSWREVCELNRDHPEAAELFNPDKLPAVHDPFAGGGTIPLEAQRLGLDAYASDLNPVAVLINKAMIEIPPKFSGRAPVGPPGQDSQIELRTEWAGAAGLAEDVRRYGEVLCEEARRKIGHLYPPVEVTADIAKDRPDLRHLIGQKLTAVAWLWARTVKSPNPAYSSVDVPLASTFIVSSKESQQAYIEPVVDGNSYRFTVKIGRPTAAAEVGTKVIGRGSNFRCLFSDVPISGAYIKSEGKAGRLGQRLMCVVAEGSQGRVYLPPTSDMEAASRQGNPAWLPTGAVPEKLTGGTCVPYGLREWADLFTHRQLVALTTFSDLISELREKIRKDAISAGMDDDTRGIEAGGIGASAYSEAVSVYLAFALNKVADRGSSLCTWFTERDSTRNTFARQSLPMTWDFAELNTLLTGTGSFSGAVTWTAKSLEGIVPAYAIMPGHASQSDAQSQRFSAGKVVSTDPPYYDNIGYADLSDFFYVWLRRSLRPVFPALFGTMAVPKTEELVASRHRHGSRENAESYFLEGMTQAISVLARQAHPEIPIAIYYAFKQSETKGDSETSSTGWETFLEAVHRAGLQLSGTWPMRTELANRMIGSGNNALASCIVLVCRNRPEDAPAVSRREFIRELNMVLPEALDEMTKGSGDNRSPVAPVDLSQAIIGPGMAVFSKYAAVLEADGSAMSVRTALQLINRFLAEDDFDADTQFCLHWFEQYGWKDGKFGDADTLARAKATSVSGIVESGVIHSGGGRVMLVKFGDYPADWDPQKDKRLPVWEVLHHLIRALKQDGERGAGRLLAVVKAKAEAARQLAYRLYTLCERQGWAEDARAYNELITSWTAIESAAGEAIVKEQPTLFGETR